MRLELESICAVAESLHANKKKGDTAEVWKMLRRFEDFDMVFSSHSMVEDDFVFPALAMRGCAGITASAAEEHEEESALMRSAQETLRRAAETQRVDAEACAVLRTLKERLSEHMLREEEAIFPSLARFTSAELSKLVALVLGSRPAETLEATIRMEITHLDADHARHVVSTMCDVAKNTRLKDWLRFKFDAGAFSAKRALTQSSYVCAPELDPVCPHYGRRAALLRAPCCNAAVCCRRCHDASGMPCPVSMDQKAVESMVCARCGLDQPVAASCAGCGVRVADYYCAVCRHFIADGNPTFHCPYCNVCRRGHGLGVDYAHCMDCNLCVLLDHFESHYCAARDGDKAATTSCAVCAQPFFQAQERVVLLDCGHPKHASCPSGPTCDACAAPGVGGLQRRRSQRSSKVHNVRLPAAASDPALASASRR